MFKGRMLPYLLICAALVASLGATSTDSPSKPRQSRLTKSKSAEKADKNVALKNYGKLPLHFETNEGQSDPRVRFLARGQGYQLFLEPTVATLSLRSAKPVERKAEEWMPGHPRLDLGRHDKGKRQAEKQTFSTLRMKLVGANGKAKASGHEKLPGISNYLIGNDKSKWHTGIANYAKVQFDSVYPGIDLVYYGNQRQLEHDFVVAPGADPKKIRLSFEGAKGLSIGDEGHLNIKLNDGNQIQFTHPVVYQTIKDKKVMVKGRYALLGKNHDQVGFELAPYDKRRALTIDPLLLYSTYLGGDGEDQAYSIAIDSDGNAYVTGTTSGGTPTGFPTTGGQTTYGGGTFDAFVTKMNPGGSGLVYSTYLGGSAEDDGYGIAVDSAGQAYVVGQTASSGGGETPPDFPSGTKAYNTANSGGFDAFLVVLGPSGTSLLYSTFLGGSQDDSARAVAIGTSGIAYIAGTTSSGNADFPTTTGAYQTSFNMASGSGDSDAFVAKLDTTVTGSSSLIYSTYLGGGDTDQGFGIAVDGSGSAYVVGATRSCGTTNPPAFPTVNAFRGTCQTGLMHAFVSRLNSLGSVLLYSTFLGGTDGDDQAFAIAIDSANKIYVTGSAVSTLPTSPGAFQPSTGGSTDAFVAKFNPVASGAASLIYLTYLGGTHVDSGQSIAVDSSGGAIVTGYTASGNFPTTRGGQNFGGNSDAFVLRLNALGSAISYGTFLGGSGFDYGYSVVVDVDGNAYVTGQTDSTNFPHTADAYQGFLFDTENDDAFITKFAGTAPLQATFFYEAIPQSGTHKPFADTITLQDRFLTQDVKVKYGTDFGIPIDTPLFALVDPSAHFVNYRITATTATPLVTVTDDLLADLEVPPLQLLLHGGITLMVPAFERAPHIDPTNPPLTAKQHYRCYDVNAALPANSGIIDETGQFITAITFPTAENELLPSLLLETTFALVKPRTYCVAVKVTNDDGDYDSDITSTSNNYMCYEAVRIIGLSAPPTTVRTLEQFGPSVFETVNNNLLCLPSTIVPNEGPG